MNSYLIDDLFASKTEIKGKRRREMKIIFFFIVGILIGFFGFKYLSSSEPTVFEQLAQRQMKEYMDCMQSNDYMYMKHHRNMVINLIKEGKYDYKDSFFYGLNNKDELFYYAIGEYFLKEDGTLFAKKLKG